MIFTMNNYQNRLKMLKSEIKWNGRSRISCFIKLNSQILFVFQITSSTTECFTEWKKNKNDKNICELIFDKDTWVFMVLGSSYINKTPKTLLTTKREKNDPKLNISILLKRKCLHLRYTLPVIIPWRGCEKNFGTGNLKCLLTSSKRKR